MRTDNINAVKFRRNYMQGDIKDCWEWTGSLDHHGYGDYNHRRAHRVAYYIANGDFDQSLHVLHICDNPKCVNPSHLRLGTQSDNMSDMVVKERNHPYNSTVTKCKQGHDFSIENTYYYKNRRQCKLCKKLRQRKPVVVEIIDSL